jgi:hypothetical protein
MGNDKALLVTDTVKVAVEDAIAELVQPYQFAASHVGISWGEIVEGTPALSCIITPWPKRRCNDSVPVSVSLRNPEGTGRQILV